MNFTFRWRFIGPWLRSSFTSKGYMDWEETEPWISQLLDDYDEMIEGIATSIGMRFRYVDVRPVVGAERLGE